MSRSPRDRNRRKIRDVFARFGSNVELQPSDEEDLNEPNLNPRRKRDGPSPQGRRRSRDLIQKVKSKVNDWNERSGTEESSSAEYKSSTGFPRGRRGKFVVI